MKKYKILLFCFALINTFLYSQYQTDNEYIGTFKATEKIYLVSQQFGKDNTELIARNVIEYDINGYPSLKALHQSNDTYAGKIVYQYYPAQRLNEEIEYNAMNQITEKRRIQILFTQQDFIASKFDRKGTLVSKTISAYDSLAHKRTETSYNASGSMSSYSIFKTDKQGRDLEKHFFDYDGYNAHNIYYTYNDLGMLVEVKQLSEHGKLLETKLYQYDYKGHVTNIGYYRADDFLIKREAFIYDVKGRLLQHDFYENSDSFGGYMRLVKSIKYEFTKYWK
jgi:hypothetical protein